MNKRPLIFVTGATGFLGGHFLHIGRKHFRFRCLARVPPRKISPGVQWVKGSVETRGDWVGKMKGCEAVVHLATCQLVDCEDDPRKAIRVILKGSRNVLRGGIQMGVRRFIWASTAEVYKTPCRMPMGECAPLEPSSFYGLLKLLADLEGERVAREKGVELCTLRFFNLVGVGVNGRMTGNVFRIFIRNLLEGKDLILHGSSRNSRDFIHVTDGALALIQALRRDVSPGIYNIGSGRETRLTEVLKKLEKIAGIPVKIILEREKGRMRRGRADIKKAMRILKFSPRKSWKDGLLEMWKKEGEGMGQKKHQKFQKID